MPKQDDTSRKVMGSTIVLARTYLKTYQLMIYLFWNARYHNVYKLTNKMGLKPSQKFGVLSTCIF